MIDNECALPSYLVLQKISIHIIQSNKSIYQIIVGRPIVCQTFAKTIDLFEWRKKTNYITFALSHTFDSCNGFLAAKNEKYRCWGVYNVQNVEIAIGLLWHFVSQSISTYKMKTRKSLVWISCPEKVVSNWKSLIITCFC